MQSSLRAVPDALIGELTCPLGDHGRRRHVHREFCFSAGSRTSLQRRIRSARFARWQTKRSRRDGDDQDDHGGSVGDFKRSERSNETHQSKTDPDARQALGGLPRAKLISREGHLSPSTSTASYAVVHASYPERSIKRAVCLAYWHRHDNVASLACAGELHASAF